ncbi:hypothetical protein BDQ12DRAFT_684407 [Crucibulum laeve]|uniref:Uncharacterized protein n=1 Tax=Crucibulum laeve TaxID=68775 RepID=A0A5C3LYN2_9AGAR|nr:hypothetical protein BDQ12DRAFT_684407 [Crucibulum laeve]
MLHAFSSIAVHVLFRLANLVCLQCYLWFVFCGSRVVLRNLIHSGTCSTWYITVHNCTTALYHCSYDSWSIVSAPVAMNSITMRPGGSRMQRLSVFLIGGFV